MKYLISILFGAGVLCLISVVFAPIGILLFILAAIVGWGPSEDDQTHTDGGGHNY